MIEGSFRAGGLASGIDTNSIVDQLTEIQRAPIRQAQRRQEAFKVQLSGIANLSSRLQALETATQDLVAGGVLSSSATEGTTGFTATAESGAPVGTFDIRVDQLARAAKARGSAFASPTDAITAGTLSLDLGGTITDITIDEGDQLTDIAFKINQSDANVTASLLNDGTNTYLTITTDQTGFEIGQPAASALTITESYTGATGSALGLGIVQDARNAQLEVDGLAIERRSNSLTDIVPDVTIALNEVTTAVETLVLQRDSTLR